LQCCALKITDLPRDYQHQCYMDIYNNRSYKPATVLAMQLYKFLSDKKLVSDTIKIIFSFCCTKTSFYQCVSCPNHDKIINRGFPKFELFDIVHWHEASMIDNKYGSFVIKFNNSSTKLTEETGIEIKRILTDNKLAPDIRRITEVPKIPTQCNVSCMPIPDLNRRHKLKYHDKKSRERQSTVSAKVSKEEQFIEINDSTNVINKRFDFSANNGEWILDYYYANGLLFVELIDENYYYGIENDERHDWNFADPVNHRIQIYDIKSGDLAYIHKLPLPTKYRFKQYNYFLDYADSSGYYVFDFINKTTTHYPLIKTFDINKELPIQQADTLDTLDTVDTMEKSTEPIVEPINLTWFTRLKNMLYSKKVFLCTVAGLGVVTLLVRWGIFKKSSFEKILKIIS
jgi:hypothetical protein